MRRIANFGSGVFDPKRTGRLLSYKDVPRFHIEYLYRSELTALTAPPEQVKLSRPATAVSRHTKSECNIELRQETLDRDFTVSAYSLTLVKNPNVNHNSAMHVPAGPRRQKPPAVNRGITGMSLGSSITSPGRLNQRYSLSKYSDLQSMHK